ncbi:hypothetical protein SAMN05660691_01617 [Rheinheimera pacifica]|uniref:Uncharacterized protein n=1 Tax=Rheinheimera pacifica TaxID=173990 RepID=A0A1H6L9Q6_9GAMM|nr:hypothetical protein [Rheinheimera pacifica]SEH81198.1 hypothetical protein SAMN05660691_01617 [Rheinheimera pacifica]
MITLRRQALGQSMTEYIIIVALVAISGITAFRYFGGVQRSQVAAITQELAGQDSGDMLDLAQSYASKARDDASRDKGLGDYYAGGGSTGGGSGTGSGGGSGEGGGGWTPPGGGWTPPGGGIFPPPGGGGGMCPATAAQKASGTMYVWAAQSEEECREWVIHEEFSLTIKVSPLINSEKELFKDRVTTALPRIAKLITALSGDGDALSAEQKALRERIARFYGLSGSGDMLFSFLQSELLPVIQAIDTELKHARDDSSKVFRASASGIKGGYNIVNRNVYLPEDFFKDNPKEQALTIVHEYAHKVGLDHKKGFTPAHVERDRLKVLYMSPFDPEREEALKDNIDELYFLEVLLAQEW